MEEKLNKIITALLLGDDYRPFVMETINLRFVQNVHAILLKIFEARERNIGDNWWQEELANVLQKKQDILWFSGLNNKTVVSMSGGSKKSVCLELGKQNLASMDRVITEITRQDIPHLELHIRFRGREIKLSEGESLLVANTIGAMRLSVQGGAFSEVGKKVEKRLLFTIFEMLSMPSSQYVLVFAEMVKQKLVGNREIDAIVFSDDRQKKIQIELKLLAGNPEIGDEALARNVDLFLVDRSSATMIEAGRKIGVTTIEFRGKEALTAIYEFFDRSGVTVRPPNFSGIARQVIEIGKRYDESREKVAVLLKAKQLLMSE